MLLCLFSELFVDVVEQRQDLKTEGLRFLRVQRMEYVSTVHLLDIFEHILHSVDDDFLQESWRQIVISLTVNQLSLRQIPHLVHRTGDYLLTEILVLSLGL